MRIALVQCPAWGALPPLGPAALKARLGEHGHDVRCFDLNIAFHNQERGVAVHEPGGAAYADADPWGAESFDQWSLDYDGEVRFHEGSPYNDRALPLATWAADILSHRPRLVGFSVYLTSLAASLQLAEEIQRQDPAVLIVFGGPNAARDQDGNTALRTTIPDIVVDGEGEVTLTEIASVVDGHGDLSTVKGTGRLVDGSPTWTEPRPLVPKVDSLPFADFSDYDWAAYPNPYLIPIMASRGCVLNCAFCYETVYWKRYRTQGPERIVAEIEYQVRQHPLVDDGEAQGERPYFMFADSLVNGHPGGLKRMARLLIDRETAIGWGGQATINTKMDEAFFQMLSESGCTGLAFGLESGSQRVLDAMGKHYRIEDARDFMRRVHEAGVTVTVNVMVGFPTETFRDFLDTLLFLARTRRWIYQVSNVTTTGISAGSALAVHPERYDITAVADGSWESPATGTERHRRRRLRLLHRWMKLLRIPHQNIAPA